MSVFNIDIAAARVQHPDYEFVNALTPSAQKAAFHVRKGGCDYCLKIIAPNQSLERVQREVLAMQTMDHPNVAKVVEYEYSAREGQTRHYLVEQFIDGSDLSEYLEGKGPLTIDEVKSIFVPLCEGLAALAQNSIVHRDLKPSNVRVLPSGIPVIIDFGLARLLDMESLTATPEGAMIGTPRYFAPEQLKGTKRDIDPRTDLYALGVMLFEAAVGKHPYLSATPKTMDELQEAICVSESYLADPDFKSLPDVLQAILRRLLEKERANRPSNAATVAALLAKMEDN